MLCVYMCVYGCVCVSVMIVCGCCSEIVCGCCSGYDVCLFVCLFVCFYVCLKGTFNNCKGLKKKSAPTMFILQTFKRQTVLCLLFIS